MNYELTDEQELLRKTVRDFAVSRVAPVAEELDREERFPYELVLGRQVEVHLDRRVASSTISRTP